MTSHAGFVEVFGPADDTLANPHLAPSVAAYFANGGAPGARTGLQALRDVDEVAAVAIPGATAPAVQAAMIAHATTAGDRMAILDPAATDDVAAVIARREGLGAPEGHAALYFPWVEAAPAGETVLLPPSGCVAGIYARTTPPEAPIGQILTATGVSYVVTDDEQAILNPLGINANRAFPGEGVLIWGGRTLSSDPEWTYVPVRRMALALEESIHEGTAWAVLELNHEPLWAQLRIAVGDFLADRWAEGWFQGASQDDAYFVRCDRTTMAQQDLDEGRMIILVGFAPLRPAEFLLLRIVHQRTDETAAPETPGRAGPRLLDAGRVGMIPRFATGTGGAVPERRR